MCTNPYIRVLWLLPHVGSQLITFPLNRRFQPCIFCYDFPKTAKVVGKHTKKETDIVILLLYRISNEVICFSTSSLVIGKQTDEM